MKRIKPFRPLAWTLAALCVALIPSCGSDDSPANEGKTLCTVGATQSCTGPGGCLGGQTCNSDGKSWGQCDCGGTGGNGSGGTAGVDASAGSGGTSGAGAGGTSGSGGVDSGPGDAAGDAQPPGPLDDPCPGQSPLVDHIDINCSDQCQATDTAACAAMTSCDIPTTNPATVLSANDLPFTIRLPANPGLTCPCKTGIKWEPGPVQYTLWFKLAAGVTDKTAWARVDKPWYIIAPYVSTYDRCVDDPWHHPTANWSNGCATLPGSGAERWIGVGTNDPNAPSRTLVVRAPWATGTTCPDVWQ